ncbi:reverse transcriptase domain-containing protein, partial [Tanacetum coccineum]
RFLSKGVEISLPFFKVLKSCTDKENIQWTQEAEAALQEMKKFVEILPTLTTPVQGEILRMYLTASIESISAALIAKREEEHVPIYFVGRVLQGAELNYPGMEKLILALVHASRRLRRGDKTPKDFLIEVPLEDNEKKEEEKADTKSMKTELSCEWKLFTDRAASSDGSGAGLMLIDPEGKNILMPYALDSKQQTTKQNTKHYWPGYEHHKNCKPGNLCRLTVAGKSNKRYLRSQANNDHRILTEDQRGFEGLRQLHDRAYPKEPK